MSLLSYHMSHSNLRIIPLMSLFRLLFDSKWRKRVELKAKSLVLVDLLNNVRCSLKFVISLGQETKLYESPRLLSEHHILSMYSFRNICIAIKSYFKTFRNHSNMGRLSNFLRFHRNFLVNHILAFQCMDFSNISFFLDHGPWIMNTKVLIDSRFMTHMVDWGCRPCCKVSFQF